MRNKVSVATGSSAFSVLVYEPVFDGGHNLTYVRHLVSAVTGWPVTLTVVTGVGADTSPSYRTHLRPFLDGVGQLHAVVPPATPGMDWGKHHFEALMQAIDDVRPDHVFAPTADILTAYAGSRRLRGQLRRRCEPEVECNVLSAFYSSSLPSREKLHRLKTSLYASYAPWTNTFTIDPFIEVGRRPWRWIHGRVPEILPDPVAVPPVTDKAEARAAFGLPPHGLIVGGVGHFASNDRKNPLALIQGFLQSGLTADGIVALIGPMSPEVLVYVDRLPAQDRRRVVIVDRLLTSEEVQTAIAALDLVCVPYRDFYQPSAIVLNAAVLGRPVLASCTGWFASMIPLFNLGWVAELTTAAQIAKALREHRSKLAGFIPSEGSARLAAFSRGSNYAGLFTRRLRQRLGVANREPEVTWQSIVGEGRATTSPSSSP